MFTKAYCVENSRFFVSIDLITCNLKQV